MSFHRVLPRPSALSNQGLTNRWALGTDSLESAKIMPDERSKSAFLNNGQIQTSSPSQPASRTSSTQLEQYSPSAVGPDDDPQSEPSGETQIPHRVRKPAPSNIDTWQGDSPSQICLCQPDPKVPRPRNAFILYRQHHQASVVAQNPGLANPEISKVIGDHWRASAPEIKEHWKLLAEEEKVRHQKQYPDYRYQPRRSGRASSLQDSNSTSISETHRCPKCGGKSISSSNMMASGTSISAQGSPPHHGNRDDGNGMAPPTSTPSSGTPRFMRGPGSPGGREVQPLGYRFPRPQTANALPLASPRNPKRGVGVNEISPTSPGAKRRRLTNVSFAQTRGPQGPQTPFAFPSSQQRRPSLPRPEFIALSSPGAMGPPSARPTTAGLHQRSDSLKLAPLHTENGHRHTGSGGSDTQAKSLEAMIHSIPLPNKIRVLGRISAPLAVTPVPTSPATFERRKGRGIIIAIDSTDQVALKQLTETLERTLSYDYDVKIFNTPQLPEGIKASFQSYLRLVDHFHTLSHEVTAHIAPSAHTGISRETSEDPSPEEGDPKAAGGSEEESPVSPKSFPKDHRMLRTQGGEPMSPGLGEKKLPIALLPCWQLSHTDAFAISVPITDSYSPMDHWQWHATLWRGTIGADATVAVRSWNAEDQSSPPGTANSGASSEGAANANRGQEKMRPGAGGARDKGAGVELRLDDSRAVIVQGSEKGVSEGGLRRVGFEIGEWVRCWGEKDAA